MEEEKIWDIEWYRKNLIRISFLNLMIFLLSNSLKEIPSDILEIISLENIDTYKILIILWIINFYALIRYTQVLKTSFITPNYRILFWNILNHKKILTTAYVWEQEKNISINLSWKIIYDWNETSYKRIYSDDLIISSIEKLPSNHEKITIEKINPESWARYSEININYKRNIYATWLKVKFIFQDSYYSSYFLPIYLAFVTILMIEVKIFYIIINV
jgi:hypothetical protein